MVGTRKDTKGAISAVVRAYREVGLFDRYEIRYVETHGDGGLLQKVGFAVKGIFAMASALRSAKLPLVHVHLSKRGSFWRKYILCKMTQWAGRPYILHVHSSQFVE